MRAIFDPNLTQIDLETMRERLKGQILKLQWALEGLETQLDWVESALAQLEDEES
jgi:hypothetical protein